MNARTAFPEPDDELALSLAGELSHVVSFTTATPFDIAREMAAMQIAFSGLAQSRLGGRFQHRLKVSGLSPSAARRLTDRLAALPGVAGAHVEHLIVRRPGTTKIHTPHPFQPPIV